MFWRGTPPACPTYEGTGNCPTDRCDAKPNNVCVEKTAPVFECHKATAVALCPADKCMWDAATAKCNNKHATNPTQPTDHCQAITAASDCTPDKKCTFENNKCRMMTTDEAIRKEWEKVLQGSNLPSSSTTITVEKMNQYFAQSDPFNADANFKRVDTADTNKDKKITKDEYENYSKYMHERMGEEGRMSKCVLSFNKWQKIGRASCRERV